MAGSIEITGLIATRGMFTLNVEYLSVAPREIFAILGETGSGKTVLLESIAGAFPLDSGNIMLDGKDVGTLPIQQRHLGILYQDHALFPHLTVEQNVGYGLKRNGCPKSDLRYRVTRMLDLFGITHLADVYPGVISGGESQRCALARALILEPDILLLDEPFSALDPSTKKRVYSQLLEIHAHFNCTIVFVTHDFNEVCSLADRVGIVLDGTLREIRSAKTLFEGEYDNDIQRFLGIEDGNQYRADPIYRPCIA